MSEITEVKDGQNTDPVAGVSILLSRRASSNVLGRGHVDTRIDWVRLAGPICNLFLVVVVYIPHKGRTQSPTAQETMYQLKTLLITVPKSDCVIMGGDLNCQLQRNVPGCTGKWCMTTKPDGGHGEEMFELMRLAHWTSTTLKPAHRKSALRLRTCTPSCKQSHFYRVTSNLKITTYFSTVVQLCGERSSTCRNLATCHQCGLSYAQVPSPVKSDSTIDGQMPSRLSWIGILSS